jgi:non-specific serine/threonine protein kinase
MALILGDLGSLALGAGDTTAALGHFAECVTLSRDPGPWVGLARRLVDLGDAHRVAGDRARAVAGYRESLLLSRDLDDPSGIAFVVAAIAGLAGAAGQPAAAARLWGFSETIAQPPYRVGINVVEAQREQDRARTRERLGAAAFAAAADAGRDLSNEQAAIEALALVDALAAARDTPAPDEALPNPSGLTPREVEVLRSIAAGASNRAIGETLVLSVRTVERHIANIYEKLGVRGRAARATATAYALTHGLAPTPPLRHP